MGEHRPYRVPGSATDARLMRVKRIAILSLASAFVAINWVTTQHAAKVLRDAPWLGRPLFHLPVIGTLYAPWAWITWWIRWHAAPALAPLWTLCAREALYPMAVIAAVAAGVIAFTRNGSLANASDLHGSARWANTRDLTEARLIDSRGTRLRSIAASLRLVRPRAHRACVYLGVWRRSLIRDRSHTHVLVVGPTQSGKGRGIVIPTLLTWPHSVIVNDVKDENWALTAGARKRMGQLCLRFEPTSAEDGRARFNPLSEVRLRTPREIRDVHNIVRMVLDPYGAGPPDHWERAGGAALTGFILHQLYEGHDPTLSGVEARLSDPARTIDETLEQLLCAEHDPSGSRGWHDSRGNPTHTHPFVARAMRSLLNKAEKERSSVISEITEFMPLYRDPVIAANTAVSDFRITDLMNHERPVSLYIVVALADQDTLTPLIRLMLSQILHRLTERLAYRDGRAVPGYRHRLLLMIDEFPTLGRLDMFAKSLSLIAGYGIKACLIAQDLTQIRGAYGHDETITSNCDTRVAFRPNGIETARLLSQMTGEASVRHSHRTTSSSGASVSEPEVARPLLTADEAMRLGSNEELIFASGRPTIRARKLRHYSERAFKRLAKIQPPLVSDLIERDTEPEAETVAPVERQSGKAVASVQKTLAPTVVAAKEPAAQSQPGEQLSFLRFAIENKNGSGDAASSQDAKERLL